MSPSSAVSVVVLTTIAYFVIRIWSISPEAVGFVGQFFDAVLIAFIGFIIYDGIRVVIDRRIWEEGDSFEAAEPGDEGSAKSSSRLATLLPLARNFMLITVAVMTVMIVAAELGVNIAPLFAGAGVVGLAVGFGAQTLIADIFSGAFFPDRRRVPQGRLRGDGKRARHGRENLRSVHAVASPYGTAAYDPLQSDHPSDELFARLGDDES